MANAIAHELYALTHGATREELEQRIETLLEERSDGLDMVAGRISNELDDDYRPGDYRPGSDSVADAACDAIDIAKSYRDDVESALETLNEALTDHGGTEGDDLAQTVINVVAHLNKTHAWLEEVLQREREAASAEGRVTKEDHEASERSVGILRSGLVGALNALDAATASIRAPAKRRERAVLNARAAIAQGQERLRRGSPGDKEVPPQKV